MVAVAHTTFFKTRMSLLQFMCEILNEKATGGCRGDLRNGARGRGPAANASAVQGPYQIDRLNCGVCLSQQEWKILEEAVKGLKVRISHRPGVVRVYRVNSLRESAENLWLVHKCHLRP